MKKRNILGVGLIYLGLVIEVIWSITLVSAAIIGAGIYFLLND